MPALCSAAALALLAAAQVAAATGAGDPCIDDDFGVSSILNSHTDCTNANVNLGADCGTFGHLCPRSCGLCPASPVPDCTPEDIVRNKQDLMTLLQELGLCPDCAVPAGVRWQDARYVRQAGPALLGVEAGGWTSGIAGDPCGFDAGVACDRCGELFHFYLGFPVLGRVAGPLSDVILRFRRLSNFLFWLAPGQPKSELPAGRSFAELPGLTSLHLRNSWKGPASQFANITRLDALHLQQNEVTGDIGELFGTERVLEHHVEQATGLHGRVPETICRMANLTSIVLNVPDVAWEVPACMADLVRLDFVTVVAQVTGPVAPLFGRPGSSPELRRIIIQGGPGHRLNGTLPSSMSACTRLEEVDLSGNDVEGALPDLSNATGLKTLLLAGNRITGAGSLTGTELKVDLRNNRIAAWPVAWKELPGTASLDLSGNPLSEWPSAGVYPADNFGPEVVITCGNGPAVRASRFDWPRMAVLVLDNCPLNVTARRLLTSLAYLPALTKVSAANCGLFGPLKKEAGYLTPVADLPNCNDYSVEPGFSLLEEANLADNRIELVGAPPWSRRLSLMNLGSNDVAEVHPSWYEGGVGTVVLLGNPRLRAEVRPPPAVCPVLGGGLVADPTGFSGVEGEGFMCTSLCPTGFFPSVSYTANESSLCHCRPGFAGSGTACSACPRDQWSGEAATACAACPPNSATVDPATGAPLTGASAIDACVCTPGFYRLNRGTASQSCEACPAHHHRAGHGAESAGDCVPCPAGQFAPAGSASCSPCPEGTDAAGPGAGCVCGRGFYNNGTSGAGSTCVACPGGKSTFVTKLPTGTLIHPEDCECPPGTWLFFASPGAEPQCSAQYCDGGLLCPGGDAAPRQAEFYHVGSPAFPGGPPAFLSLCGSLGACPGGRELGGCPEHHTGRACELCEVGFYADGSHKCRPCSDSLGPWPVVLGVLAVIGLSVLLAVYVTREIPVFNQSAMSVALSGTLSLYLFQVMGSFSRLTVEWIEPLKSCLSALRVLTLDVETLNLACAFQSNSPVLGYLASLMTFPGFVAILLVTMAAMRAAGRRVDGSRVTNALGLVMFAFNLALAIKAVLPWQCEANPDGTSALAWKRAVICWQSGEHRAMLGISLLGVGLYIVSPVTVVLWATVQYPHRVARPGGTVFFERFRFLFARFWPEAYWYGAVQVLKNLGTALIPILFVNYKEVQILAMGLLISSLGFVQYAYFPWHCLAANRLDGLIALQLILILMGGAVLLEAGSSGMDALQGFFLTTLLLTLAVLLSMLALNVYHAVLPRKRYGVFLSHHKGSAAVLARWFKMVLSGMTRSGIFLDSDELDDLSSLFHIVRNETLNFVILMTAQTPLRPWCAGEFVSAVEGKINTVVVGCEDMVPMTDGYIADVGATWSEGQKTEVAALGITLEKVHSAYRVIRDLPVLSFDRSRGEAEREATLLEAFKRCQGLTGLTSHVGQRALAAGGSDLDGQVAVVIAGNLDDPETATICHILRLLLQKRMQMSIGIAGGREAHLQDAMAGARHVLQVLTKGCLSSPTWAKALLASTQVPGLAVLPVNADRAFEFPSELFWEQLERGEVLDQAACELEGIATADVGAAYKALFKQIAAPISPHASERILETEATEVLRRLRGLARMASEGSMGRKGTEAGGSEGAAPKFVEESV